MSYNYKVFIVNNVFEYFRDVLYVHTCLLAVVIFYKSTLLRVMCTCHLKGYFCQGIYGLLRGLIHFSELFGLLKGLISLTMMYIGVCMRAIVWCAVMVITKQVCMFCKL